MPCSDSKQHAAVNSQNVHMLSDPRLSTLSSWLRSADEAKGMHICQMNAADRAEFPQASRVVRVGDAAWNSADDDLLEQLSAIIERRVQQQKPNSLEALSALLEPPPRGRCKQKYVYLLYGPRMIFVDEENQMSADIRGLVFEKMCESAGRDIVLNL